MPRLATRYKNQKCVIKDTSGEGAWEGIIRSIFAEGDSTYYEVETDEGIVHINTAWIEWLTPVGGLKPVQEMQPKGKVKLVN